MISLQLLLVSAMGQYIFSQKRWRKIINCLKKSRKKIDLRWNRNEINYIKLHNKPSSRYYIGNSKYLPDNWINEYLLEKLQTLQNTILIGLGSICCFFIDPQFIIRVNLSDISKFLGRIWTQCNVLSQFKWTYWPTHITESYMELKILDFWFYNPFFIIFFFDSCSDSIFCQN
jgi:hypothetical protein